MRTSESILFDAVCEAAGLSNRAVAAFAGIDERTVRDMRSGLRAITLPLLGKLPPSITQPFLTAYQRQLAADSPQPSRTPYEHVARVTHANGELAAALVVAVHGGTEIRESQRPFLARAVRRVVVEAESAEAAILGRSKCGDTSG